ncbi:MAG: hypothetical protein ACI4XE_05340 [Acutalibacteraceae bacterium]
MKLGKKALSCVLAIMMIVSSVSVCFSVLGATDTPDGIFTQIEMHYEGLMDAIDKAKDTTNPDTSGVPTLSGSIWTVEKDTFTGGWQAVAKAFAAFAKGTAGVNNTYADLVADIKDNIPAAAQASGLPQADYEAIVDYFKFGNESTGSFGTAAKVQLAIGSGFDLLGWSTVEDIDLTRAYYTATLTMTPSGSNGTYTLATADCIKFSQEDYIIPSGDNDITAIKDVLTSCVASDKFSQWFTQSTLTEDQLGEFSNLYNLFTDTITLSGYGYTAEDVWDHYVAKRVGKTYTEAEAWYNTAGADAKARPLAEQYITDLDALMAKDYSAMTADELLAHYNDIAGVRQEINENTYSGAIKKIMNELKASDYIGQKTSTVETYIQALGLEVAKAYAAVYADELVALAKEVTDGLVPTYDRTDESAAAAWEGSEDQAKAQDWLDRATVLKGNIDSLVLDKASFADVQLVESVNGTGNRLTEADYNTVVNQMKITTVDCGGSDAFANKTAMDTFMKTTILAGKRYTKLQADAEEFRSLYNKALELKNDASKEMIFAEVYPDGLDEYAAYLNSIKAAAAERIYNQLYYNVAWYAGEGNGKVHYYNFESIIQSWEALEVASVAALRSFLDADPAYVPTTEQIKVADISTLWTKCQNWYNQAVSFKTGLNNLRNAAYNNSTATTNDKKILAYILKQESNSYSGYGWETIVGQLDYSEIQQFVNDIELQQGSDLNLSKIRDLMDAAVEDLDRMLISDDLGTLLKSITEATDETGTKTNMLGVWKHKYTFKNPDGTTTTRNVGDEVVNLREFLICTVVNLLWSGSIQTMLFKLLNEAIGPGVYTLDQDLSVLGNARDALPRYLRCALPTMPHWYTENWNGHTSTGQSGVQWYKYFTGDVYGHSGEAAYDYTDILRVLEQAPYDTSTYGSGDKTRTYWKDNDSYNTGTKGIPESAWENLDSEAAWHVESWSDFYRTMAVATCGLHAPLAELVSKKAAQGSGTTLVAKVYIWPATYDISAPITNTGDALYDRLFIPLYRMLGIEGYYSSSNPGGYRNHTDMMYACDSWAQGGPGDTPMIRDYGVTLWQYLMEPIIYWMENTLFVKPVETILDLLPNLLTLLEYDQLLPKLRNIVVNIKIIVLSITINITDLSISDIVMPLIEDMGLTTETFKLGINGLLKILLSATRVTGKPAVADGVLMAVVENADGTKEASTTQVASAVLDGKTYYFTNCGMLTQTLYNMLGDGLLKWFNWSSANVGTIPLELPVNRFMSTGTLKGGDHPNSESISIAGVYSTVVNYHIYTKPGDTLLTLFRWLLDDGTIYAISPLLEGLIPANDDGSSVLDTIFQIVDGQADAILSILICLLNAYSIDFTPYKDQAQDPSTWGTWNAEGTEFESYLNDDYTSKFQVGKFLLESLSAKNASVTDPATATTEQLIDKADLAIANLDTVIGKLVPTIVSLLGDTLRGLGLGFEDVITKVEEGQLTTITDIVTQGVITNDLVDMLMKLLFGTKEQKETTAEDGTTTPVVDENGNPVIDNGLLGDFLGDPDSIIVKLLDALATFGIDITPLGFYNTAIDSSTSSYNVRIAVWLNRQAAKHAGRDLSTTTGNILTTTAVKAELANMTWADIGVEAGFSWFTEDADASKRLDNFIELVCDILGPLNPLFGFLLSGQNITLMDELTLQGNKGYSKAVVPILEALGLDSACVYQNQFDSYVYNGTDLTSSSGLLSGADPNAIAASAGTRLAKTKNSPLRPLLDAIKVLLLGDGTNKGLLEAPVTVLLTKLPNIAYFMCMYTGDDGKRTSNLSVAVQNFIAPVLKLLQIVDPILSRVIVLDLEETLNNFLDIETMLNTLLGRLVGDGASFNLDLLDFASLAADSSLKANPNAPTYRGNVGDTFTKFEASPGQFFITLMRAAASKELIDALADVINGLFNKNPAENQDEVESRERINNIIKIISTNLCKPVTDSDANGAQYIDILTGLLIDVLTDYEPADGEFYFYEVLNRVDDQLITDVEQTSAWTTYAIDHEGYDWDSTADKFTEDDVNEAIENLDYVIKQAVPDVLSALSEEGMLDLGGMQFDFDAGDGLWTLLQNIISGNLFTDNIFDTVVNLICGLLGKSGNTGTATIANALKAAGFDITFDAFLYDKDGKKTAFYDYITYGFDKDADGNLIKSTETNKPDMYTIDGETVELTWAQIYKNHSYIAYEFDEDGNLVTNADGTPKYLQATTTDADGNEVPSVDEDGNPIYVRELRKTGAVQLQDASGNYLYTYTDENGDEQTYASQYDQLQVYTVGTGANATTYTLSAKYDENAAKDWAWGIDTVTGADANETYYNKKNAVINTIWQMITPFAPLFSALFAGDALKLFEGINLEGNTAYANVLLPLLRAFGFEETIRYLSTTDSEVSGKTKLDLINDARPNGEKIPANFMSVEEYYTMVYGDAAGPESGNAMSAEGMGKAVKTMADYVFNFLEVVATYPIQTIMTALPTLAYFIYGDGLTTLVSNILVPVTTLTDRLEPIVKLDVNSIGAGLLDALSTGSWENFQNALQTYVTVDEETGEIIVNETQQFSLTDSILSFLGSLEFDLSSVLGKNDDNIEEGEYSYGLMLFINKEVEVRAKELLATADKLEKEDATANKEAVEQLRAEARNLRGGTLKGFFQSIAALGDSYADLGETAPNGAKSTNVKVDQYGQVPVSKAEVLMFLLNFAFQNQALKETVGNLLGYDLTDENTDDAEMLDEIITNVFNNPDALVDLIVELLTQHDITEGIAIDLIDIKAETHYDFYEDAGYESHEEVLEAIKNGEDVSEISRMKTAAAIDNLDSLVGTILNLFKDQLFDILRMDTKPCTCLHTI